MAWHGVRRVSHASSHDCNAALRAVQQQAAPCFNSILDLKQSWIPHLIALSKLFLADRLTIDIQHMKWYPRSLVACPSRTRNAVLHRLPVIHPPIIIVVDRIIYDAPISARMLHSHALTPSRLEREIRPAEDHLADIIHAMLQVWDRRNRVVRVVERPAHLLHAVQLVEH